jgi:hypothetical protein
MTTTSFDQLGDENTIRDAARRMRAAGETSANAGQVIEQTIQSTQWSGPMKLRYVEASTSQNRELRRDADELANVATRLDRHAQWIVSEKSRLDGIANRIRSWAAAHPAGSSKTGQDASMISSYPARHNFGWDRLADSLRARGVAF